MKVHEMMALFRKLLTLKVFTVDVAIFNQKSRTNPINFPGYSH